ncbi:MAG: hypothetical protein RLZZ458_2927, partial [Planctomycetota bacterium]
MGIRARIGNLFASELFKRVFGDCGNGCSRIRRRKSLPEYLEPRMLLSSFAVSTAAVPYGQTGIVSADFNGDGSLDLATSSPSGAVMALAGNGSGSFGFQSILTGSIGAGYDYSIAAGQFGGSSAKDIVASSYTNNRFGILVNNGTGSFALNAMYSPAAGLCGITVADFNADGNDDIAVASNSTNTVHVEYMNGSGG